jgi:SPP1 gp7 family putative phage head morphogenesis protein
VLRGVVADIRRAVGELDGLLAASLPRADARTDAGEDVRIRVRARLHEIRSNVLEVDHTAEIHEIGARVAAANGREIKRVIGIDARQIQGVSNLLDGFRRQNVDLITNMTRETLDQIDETVEAAWTAGERVETLRDKLKERFDVSESRADLIARDQVLKLNSQITKTRQTAAGITEYIWSTSGDERVRGNPNGLYPDSDRDHYALDGKRFRWDAPPVINPKTGETAHPGEDFQCRCVATPVLDFLDET